MRASMSTWVLAVLLVTAVGSALAVEPMRGTRPGLGRKPVAVEHECMIAGVDSSQPVVGVTWKINALKPEVDGARMVTVGVDEKGSAQFTVHAASGIVTKLTRVVKRVDQMATRGADGRITQETLTATRTLSFSMRQKDAAPAAPSSPESVAKAILTAYKAKDFPKLMVLCVEANRPILKAIAQQGEKHPRYGSLFKQWRWTAVQGWDGKLREVRYPSATKAWASFHEDHRRGTLFVVVLVREGGAWRFEDINNLNKTRFQGAARTP